MGAPDNGRGSMSFVPSWGVLVPQVGRELGVRASFFWRGGRNGGIER